MPLFSQYLNTADVFIFYIVAVLIGMAKTGVQGAGMLSVPLLALVFGGQASTGILLPVLCVADILGLWYYHRHADWTQLKTLFPWAALGIVAGTVVGNYIDDQTFRIIMALAILLSVFVMIVMEHRKESPVPGPAWGRLTGVAGGFTSMVGNLAGPLMAVYFLTMKLPKYVFIGTAAWFFLVMNFFKIPFHVFYWKTITVSSFVMSLTSIPAVIAGAVLGVFIVKRLSENVYRWFIIAMTIIAAVLMITI